jgi:hypothetical protein
MRRWAGSITPRGLEAARSKGVLGFDGIKVHRMTGPSGLLFSYLPLVENSCR